MAFIENLDKFIFFPNLFQLSSIEANWDNLKAFKLNWTT